MFLHNSVETSELVSQPVQIYLRVPPNICSFCSRHHIWRRGQQGSWFCTKIRRASCCHRGGCCHRSTYPWPALHSRGSLVECNSLGTWNHAIQIVLSISEIYWTNGLLVKPFVYVFLREQHGKKDLVWKRALGCVKVASKTQDMLQLFLPVNRFTRKKIWQH